MFPIWTHFFVTDIVVADTSKAEAQAECNRPAISDFVVFAKHQRAHIHTHTVIASTASKRLTGWEQQILVHLYFNRDTDNKFYWTVEAKHIRKSTSFIELFQKEEKIH